MIKKMIKLNTMSTNDHSYHNKLKLEHYQQKETKNIYFKMKLKSSDKITKIGYIKINLQ